MSRTMTMISLLGAGLAFAASCATLALMGLGVPMLVSAAAAAAAAGLVLHAALLAQVARPAAALQTRIEAAAASAAAAAEARLSEVEARAASLRHDLRGVLSPALMVTDRLLGNPDPAVQRAGQAVIRSVERATAIIQASKAETAEAGQAAPAARVGHGAG